MTTQIAEMLSTDLHVITAEINTYKRIAGEAIFEIGRRLKHVKEHDLAHGEWEQWCRDKIDISASQARMFIKVAGEFGANRCTFNDLGLRALYEIATLPSEERERPHTIPSSGATKTVDEMTVRELREVKAALKAEREAREKAEHDYEVMRDSFASVAEKPPQVEYVYVQNEDNDPLRVTSNAIATQVKPVQNTVKVIAFRTYT